MPTRGCSPRESSPPRGCPSSASKGSSRRASCPRLPAVDERGYSPSESTPHPRGCSPSISIVPRGVSHLRRVGPPPGPLASSDLNHNALVPPPLRIRPASFFYMHSPVYTLPLNQTSFLTGQIWWTDNHYTTSHIVSTKSGQSWWPDYTPSPMLLVR